MVVMAFSTAIGANILSNAPKVIGQSDWLSAEDKAVLAMHGDQVEKKSFSYEN